MTCLKINIKTSHSTNFNISQRSYF